MTYILLKYYILDSVHYALYIMIPARGPQTKFLGIMHLEIIVGDHWLPALVASEVPERQFFKSLLSFLEFSCFGATWGYWGYLGDQPS